MKKLKKIILTLLVISLLVNPMYLSLRVHAANEELATSRISDTLQRVMSNSEEEKIEVMIWLNDIDTSPAVLSSTEAILAQAEATLSPRGLCEISATDSTTYSQFESARKDAMKDCYTTHTQKFAKSFLYNNKIISVSFIL